MYQLMLQHGKKIFMPMVEDEIVWQTDRKGSPGQLQFKIVRDKTLKISNGDIVSLKFKKWKLFYGFVFAQSGDSDPLVSVTAYDQLRYLKNKDTYVYENKTPGEFLQMIANDYRLKTGGINDIHYRIPSRIEDNTTLFDMVQNSLDLALQATGQMRVLYDSFGKLVLQNPEKMLVKIVADKDTAENIKYSFSIDDKTYNRIKLAFDNKDTGQREIYIAQNSKKINQWGLLQHYEKIQQDDNGEQKANALLALHGNERRELKVQNMRGDYRVRAGSLIPTIFNVGGVSVKKIMMVEKCKHIFATNDHRMDLVLIGGSFNA